MWRYFKSLFSARNDRARGPSLPLDLARRGWIPYRFEDSEVVVFLPESVAAAFGPDGVLYGSTDGKETDVTATLHRGFEDDRASALDFVAYLAKERRLRVRDVGTYRYFYDPADAEPEQMAGRFWVIGIPGAVVVLSLRGTRDRPASPVLAEVKQEIPHLVGELL